MIQGKFGILVLTGIMSAAACFLLWSCGGSSSTQLTQSPGDIPAGSAIVKEAIAGPSVYPPFPAAGSPVSVVRSASVAETSVGGDEFVAEEGDNNEPGPSGPGTYVIAPGGEDDLAWAMYGIAGFDPDRPVQLEIELNAVPLIPGGDDPLPLSTWVGLSNYTDYAWEWFGPYESPVAIQLNSEVLNDRYVSASNEFYYTVVTDASAVEPGPGNPQGLSAAEVIVGVTTAVDAQSDEYNDSAPHYTVDSGTGTGGSKEGSALDPQTQYVTVTWTHLIDTAEPACEASHYDIFRRRVGGAEGAALLGTVDAPQVTFIDPVDTRPLIGGPLPGESYEYYIVATNHSGSTPMSYSGTSLIPLLAPGNLTATFGLSTDWIELSWDPVEGADRYQVYRDTSSTPFASIENVTSWRDLNVPDLLEHTYWVRAVNKYNHGGAQSQPAVGRLNAAPLAVINIEPGQDSGDLPHRVMFNGFASSDPDYNGTGNGIVLYEWDVDGDGVYDQSSAAPDYEHFYSTDFGIFDAVLRVTDTQGATGTATVQIHVNNPPIASIVPSTTDTLINQPVTFSALNSEDLDGTIANYEWDFNNNGIFNEETNGESLFSGLVEATTMFFQPGNYLVTVRVTDDFGSADTDSVQVNAHS